MPTWPTTDKYIEQTRFLGPARVLGYSREKGFLRILLGDLPGEQETKARVPASLHIDINVGDLVLVSGESSGELYVLSILERGFTDNGFSRSVCSRDGASVVMEEIQSSSVIKVYSKNKELLFEYDSATETQRLHLNTENLEIDVPGNISIRSGQSVELLGREVRLKAGHRNENATEPDNMNASHLSVRPEHLEFQSPELGIISKRGKIRIDELKFAADNLQAVVKRSRQFVDRAERISKMVIEKAQNHFQTVEQLTQLRTGRLRTLVDSTFHLKSRKAYMKSEKAFNIDGEKINLG